MPDAALICQGFNFLLPSVAAIRCLKINLLFLTKTSNCDCGLVFDVPLDGSVV